MAKSQRIGPMRHRITIEQHTDTDDGLGGATQSWSTRATCWAAIEHKTLAGSTAASGQIHDRTQVDFIIRERNASTARQGDRISYDSRTFDVRAVANADERGRFLRMVCVEQELG